MRLQACLRPQVLGRPQHYQTPSGFDFAALETLAMLEPMLIPIQVQGLSSYNPDHSFNTGSPQAWCMPIGFTYRKSYA